MYLITNKHEPAMPKAYREPSDPGFIWVKAGATTSISFTLEEAQALVAEITRELQAEIAAARKVAP